MATDPTFVPCDEDEFYWNLSVSENDSDSRHGEAWRQALGPRVSDRLGHGQRGALTESDWDRIRAAFRLVRGPYLEPLLDLRPRWHIGRLDVALLGDIRLIRHEPFRSIAPHLVLGEFVRALDAGLDTRSDRFAQRYRRLRPTFDPAKSLGLPILIAESFTGPFTEVDGLTRMSILLSGYLMGSRRPERLGVFVGISPRIREWAWF